VRTHRYHSRVGLPGPRLLTSAAVVAGALVLGPPVQAARTETPTLVVNFTPTGAVTVTLPNGTPVGTTSGAPTTIPPGNYTLVLDGPGNCIPEPLFELEGPSVDLTSDMLGSEVDTYELYASFQPNATYTWHTDWNQSIVYTFKASGTAAASTPTVSGTSSSAGASSTPTSIGIVGSEYVPSRGKLTVSLTRSGVPGLFYGGKRVTSLKAGQYTVSSKSSLRLEKEGHKAIAISGKRSVVLSTGTWLFILPDESSGLAIVVS